MLKLCQSMAAEARLLDGEDVPRFGDLPWPATAVPPTGSASSRDTSADNTNPTAMRITILEAVGGMLFGRVPCLVCSRT